MIFALRQPAVLLGLLLGFAVGIALVTTAQQALLRRGRGRMRAVGGRRGRTPVGTLFDPYGVAAAAIGGLGWGPRAPERPGGRGAGPGPLLVAVTVHAALAVAGFAAYLAAGGSRALAHAIDLSDVVHGNPFLTTQTVGAQVLLGFAAVNLGCGLLRLVPVPPLEAGVLLWSRLPRSPGSRRMAYHLLEESWGVAIVLVLLILPLGGRLPLLLVLLDAVAGPLLRLV